MMVHLYLSSLIFSLCSYCIAITAKRCSKGGACPASTVNFLNCNVQELLYLSGANITNSGDEAISAVIPGQHSADIWAVNIHRLIVSSPHRQHIGARPSFTSRPGPTKNHRSILLYESEIRKVGYCNCFTVPCVTD